MRTVGTVVLNVQLAQSLAPYEALRLSQQPLGRTATLEQQLRIAC
jgi:hypothetical protein